MRRLAFTMVAVALLTPACGQSEQEQRAEELARRAQEAAQSAGSAAEEAVQGLEAMARGLEAMAGGGDGETATVEPVRFQELIALLPEIDGWERREPTGERVTAPFPTANARALYTRDDARISVEIVDSAFNQMLLGPMAMFLRSGYAQESTSGYEKSTTVNGQPGWEKWDIDSSSGEVNALVGKRFLVTIEGDGITDASVLQDVASTIDFDRLGSLQ